MKRLIIFWGLILLSLASCSRADFYKVLTERSVNKFYFTPDMNPLISYDITASTLPGDGETVFTAVFPNDTDITTLCPSFDINGYAMFVNGMRQVSGKSTQDFGGKVPVQYTIYSYDGRTASCTIRAVNATAYFLSVNFPADFNPVLGRLVKNSDGSSNVSCVRDKNTFWFDMPQSVSLQGLVPLFDTETADGSGASIIPLFENSGGAFVEGDAFQETDTGKPFSFSGGQVFRVKASDGSYLDYMVSPYRLTSFNIKGYNKYFSDNGALINDGKIEIELPYSANLKSIVPEFSFLGDSVYYINGDETIEVKSGKTAIDFSSPVDFHVAVNAGIEKIYSVTVTKCASPSEQPENPDPAPPYLPDGSGMEGGGDVSDYIFTLSYDINGGTAVAALPAQQLNWGQSVILPGYESVIRPGYALNFWNTYSDGSGASYLSGSPFAMPPENTILYAIWNPGHVYSVSVSSSSLSLAVGSEAQLTAAVFPSDVPDSSVSWTSSDTAVASVSSSGVVLARNPGSAVVRATANDNGLFSDCSVTAFFNSTEETLFTNGSLPVTPSGTVYPVPDRKGVANNAVFLEGNAYEQINFGSVPSLDFDEQNAFSVSIWVNFDPDSLSLADCQFFCKDGGAANNFEYIIYINMGKIGAVVNKKSDSSNKAESTSVVNANQWYHAVMVFNPLNTGSEIQLYINASLAASFIYLHGDLSPSTGQLYLGSNSGGTVFKGALDDLRVFTYALNQTEITALYKE